MLHEELMDMIMDHYENPRNYGKLDAPDVQQTGGNPGCGDDITVYLSIQSDRVRDIKFEISGCIVSQASTSLISELIKGRTTEEVKSIGLDDMKELLSKDIAIRRPQCISLGINTIKMAITKYEKQRGILNSGPGFAEQ